MLGRLEGWVWPIRGCEVEPFRKFWEGRGRGRGVGGLTGQARILWSARVGWLGRYLGSDSCLGLDWIGLYFGIVHGQMSGL